MKLAFYYHISIYCTNNKFYVPSFLGVFLDSIAKHVLELHIIFHQAVKEEKNECNYILKGDNFIGINLGVKTSAPHRSIFHHQILGKAINKINECDILLVRSPSPLAPFFAKYFNKKNFLFYLIVGDYIESIKRQEKKSFRFFLSYLYVIVLNYFFLKSLKRSNLIVNSDLLYLKYKGLSKSLHKIKTTTLSDSDFYAINKEFTDTNINLVFTGRIDPNKGLFELVRATSILEKNYKKIKLHIVGWEDDEILNPIKSKLIAYSKKHKIKDHIVFHGRKAVGKELNEMYRMGNIYVLPSYHEGFPRTIWEAMANSLPVITTKVGGIPNQLTHKENAILINPKSYQEIVDAVEILINDNKLRKKIINNGLLIAKENTLEKSAIKLFNIFKDEKNI